MNHEEILISSKKSVRDAMIKMDGISSHLLFVMCDSLLVGTLTDGDIRRYLLSGGNLEEEIFNVCKRDCLKAFDIAEADRILEEFPNLMAVPIINSSNEIIEIRVGGERVYNPINIPVVINAGGKGTRLDPFTRVLPKPLIPIGQYPIIEHIMRRFNLYQCSHFNVIVNYKKSLMKAFFADGEKNYDIDWIDEDKPLGTGGGLSLLRGKLKKTFFFTNCDILLKTDLSCIYEYHRKQNNLVTMVCAYKNMTVPYGVVNMGINGTILSMEEKPTKSYLTNTGLYVVEPKVLDFIEDDVAIGFPDIIQTVIDNGGAVSVYPISESEWLDMGQIDEMKHMIDEIGDTGESK